MVLRPLFEAVVPSLKSAIGAGDRVDLQDTISDRLTDSYVKASRKALGELYEGSGQDAPTYHLQAKWKRKALQQQARTMALSLSETVAKERERLAAKGVTGDELDAQMAKFLVYKTRQLDEIIQAEAGMQAQVDQLVHTGAVDPARDRVMFLRGPHTCPLCQTVFEGNPHTVNQATNYGAKLHPNCRDHWEQHWTVNKATTDTMRQRIRDGTLRGWDGSGRTPGHLSAKAGQAITQAYGEDWGDRRRKAIADARRQGRVASSTIDANLTQRQLKERQKTERRTLKRREQRLVR